MVRPLALQERRLPQIRSCAVHAAARAQRQQKRAYLLAIAILEL